MQVFAELYGLGHQEQQKLAARGLVERGLAEWGLAEWGLVEWGLAERGQLGVFSWNALVCFFIKEKEMEARREQRLYKTYIL